jgi:6-phosphogluconolactonase (cycloisomerase 2 family)
MKKVIFGFLLLFTFVLVSASFAEDIELNFPLNNSSLNTSQMPLVFNFSINFNISDNLSNCSLFSNFSGDWQANQTIQQLPTNLEQESWLQNSTSMNGANAVAVLGNYAYIASVSTDSLTVIDISNKSNPLQVGWFVNATSLDGASDIVISGDYAYIVSSSANSLTIINVSNKSKPSQISSYVNSTSMQFPYFLEIRGDYAYVTGFSSNSMAVLNISNVLNISLVDYIKDDNSLEGAMGLSIDGDYAYVVSFWNKSLTAINISNISNLSKLDTYSNDSSLNLAFFVEVLGDYAYVSNQYSGSLITVLNVSNPSNLSQISSTSGISGMVPHGFALSEDFIYLSLAGNNLDRVSIINVSDKTNPEIIENYTNTTHLHLINDVVFYDNLIYTASGGNSDALNILNPWQIKNNSIVNFDSLNLSAGEYLWSVGCENESESVFAENNFSLTISGICGNNLKESGEVCDGNDLNSETCESKGYDSGTLSCSNDCLNFDTSDCFSSSSGSSSSDLTFILNKEQLKNGYSKTLKKNWKMKFQLDNEFHELTLSEIYKKTVKIIVSSNPVTFNLSVNDIKKLDLDRDDSYDLQILLEDISDDEARIFIKEINEKIKEIVPDSSYNEQTKKKTITGDIIYENQSGNNSHFLINFLLILFFIGLFFLIAYGKELFSRLTLKIPKY